jgi:hypothetical protein
MRTTPVALPQLDVYDIAYLAGGPARVVDAVVVALVRAGRVRIHSPGQLATTELSRRHPVEAAVLDAVGPTGHRSVDTIHWRVADDDRLLEVGRRLRSAGLLGRSGASLRVVRGRRALAPTRVGRRVLRELRTEPALGDAEAMRVALGGREAMTDPRLREEIFERVLPPVAPGGLRRRLRAAEDNDPFYAAYRTRGAVGGAATIGFLDGGGFGDGGFGGGGGGGGDGGGGG